MKLLKSDKKMVEKFKGGKTKTTRPMSPGEATSSYEAYPDDIKCDGTEMELRINDETYYHWVFYPETPPTQPDKKRHFEDDMEQERYEWFCGGWVQFYDDILRPVKEMGGKEHKLFFCWDNKGKTGVTIYINDQNAGDKGYQMRIVYDTANRQLSYTAPPVSDPPTVPPPPPPSKT